MIWTDLPYIKRDEYAETNDERRAAWASTFYGNRLHRADFTPRDPEDAITEYENRRGE